MCGADPATARSGPSRAGVRASALALQALVALGLLLDSMMIPHHTSWEATAAVPRVPAWADALAVEQQYGSSTTAV
jgi:hypothetical protein